MMVSWADAWRKPWEIGPSLRRPSVQAGFVGSQLVRKTYVFRRRVSRVPRECEHPRIRNDR